MGRKIYLFSLLIPVVCLVHSAFAVPGKAPAPPQSAAMGEEKIFADKLKSADGYARTRDYLKAGELYREVYLGSKKGPTAERALFNICKTNFSLKRFNEARLNIRRFLAAYPQSEYLNECYLLLGYIAFNTQKLNDARQYFEMVKGPLEDRANIGKAEIAMKTENIARAENIIADIGKRVLESNPRALAVRALIYSRKGMHREAVAAISKIMDPILKEEGMRYAKALIFYNASRFADAEKICLSILRDPASNSEKTNAKKILFDIYDSRGEVDKALGLGLEIMPGETDDAFKMKIVRLYDKKGDVTSAVKYLNFLHDKSMKLAETQKRLKGIIESKDPKGAEYIRKLSLYLDPDSPYVVEAAKYLIAQGRKTEGMLLLKRAMRGPARGDASLYLAEQLINGKKYEEAKRLISPIMLDGRYFNRAVFLMAVILKQEGDYRQAIQHLLKSVKYTKDYRISAMLADLYWESGERSNAAKYYITASNMGDGSSSVKAGDYYYLSGEKKKSLAYYKRALGQGIGDAGTLQWAQYQYGKLSRDKESLKKAEDGGGLIGDAARMLAAGK